MTDSKSNGPRFIHDCAECTYLGRFEDFDLYVHGHDQSQGTLIARFSSEGKDYLSAPANHANVSALKEALTRAVRYFPNHGPAGFDGAYAVFKLAVRDKIHFWTGLLQNDEVLETNCRAAFDLAMTTEQTARDIMFGE